MVNFGKYHIKKTLAIGEYSTVYLVETSDNEIYALKYMPRRKFFHEEAKDIVDREIEIMIKLGPHPHILRLVDYEACVELIDRNGGVTEYGYIVLELAKGGELFDFIFYSGAFNEKLARHYVRQICEGIKHLHDNDISHRDLKLENILLDSELDVKIADFGFSSQAITHRLASGTKEHCAPEILEGREYVGKKVDIFNIACLLFTMVTKIRPFHLATCTDRLYQYFPIREFERFWENIASSLHHSVSFSEELKDLLNSMFAYEPDERPSIDEVMEHPWYTGETLSEEELKEELTDRLSRLPESQTQLDEPVPDQTPSPNVFTSVHRGICDDLDTEDEGKSAVEKQPSQYIPGVRSITQFFSTSQLEDLYDTLAVYVESVASTYYFTTDDYSVKFESIKDEAQISIMVNILQVPDYDNKFCVEMIKLKGDVFGYQKVFSEFKAFFGGHVNATIHH